jgi:hypothetical protein
MAPARINPSIQSGGMHLRNLTQPQPEQGQTPKNSIFCNLPLKNIQENEIVLK